MTISLAQSNGVNQFCIRKCTLKYPLENYEMDTVAVVLKPVISMLIRAYLFVIATKTMTRRPSEFD